MQGGSHTTHTLDCKRSLHPVAFYPHPVATDCYANLQLRHHESMSWILQGTTALKPWIRGRLAHPWLRRSQQINWNRSTGAHGLWHPAMAAGVTKVEELARSKAGGLASIHTQHLCSCAAESDREICIDC